jgi:hypothetical protein
MKKICPTFSFKKGTLSAIFIISITLSFAQVESSGKPTFGVRAGLTSSGMRGDAFNNLTNLLSFSNGAITTQNVYGFFGGVYGSMPIGDIISADAGLYYSQKGYQITGDLNVKGFGFLGANAKAKLQSEYIDIPVLLKANINGFQVFAGPQFSYLMKANLTTTAGLLGFNIVNSKMDATNEFYRWDMGVTGGIGYKLTNGFNITASYDYGLSKLDKNQNTKAYNNSFKIGVGIEL